MMNARRRRFVLVTAVLAALAAPAAVHAQDTGQESPSAPAKPKKKPKKKPAPPPAADETKPAQEETKPAQDDTKPAGDDTKAASDDGKPAGEGKKAAADDSSKPPEVDITDTREDPNTRYLFAGLRYRGTVIPQFIESLFVDEGGTFYSNLIGVELDVRKNGQSMIPWIAYADYSTGDTLFHQKGSDPMIAGNYTVVRSNLKMIYLGLDELWSVPIDPQTHHWDFEFGFGVGLGIVFGDLFNNWVFQDQNGPFVASTGVHYSQCPANPQSSMTGCFTVDHQNATVQKVGGYKEPFWFSGGSVPNIFPNVWFPTLGVRYKPIKQMEARLGVGFSLTGFWFGLSADYGFEKPEDKTVHASKRFGAGRDML